MQYWPPRLIATAVIAGDGSVLRSEGIDNVNHPATGNYVIDLTNNYDPDSLHVSAAPRGSGAPSWGFAESLPPTNQITIAFEDNAGAAVDTTFTLRVYKDA